MPKRIILFASCDIVPIEHPAEDGSGEMVEAKQIVFTDGQDLIMYPMDNKAAADIGKRLKMSNKALEGQIEDDRNRAEARARLAGANGGAMPMEGSVTKDILDGIHVRKEGESQ